MCYLCRYTYEEAPFNVTIQHERVGSNDMIIISLYGPRFSESDVPRIIASPKAARALRDSLTRFLERYDNGR